MDQHLFIIGNSCILVTSASGRDVVYVRVNSRRVTYSASGRGVVCVRLHVGVTSDLRSCVVTSHF